MMKERIKQIQMMTKMSQQEFAKTIGVAPGSLSSVYSERIQPTSNYVIGIHKAFPNININWLMFGEGDMYVNPQDENPDTVSPTPEGGDNLSSASQVSAASSANHQASLFDVPASAQSDVISFQNLRRPNEPRSMASHPRSKVAEEQINFAKNFDTHKREVKEIRVFFDDGTYETFVPGKN